MKLIQRYILREYLQVLCYCLLGFALLLIVGDLFEHAGTLLDRKPGLLQVVKYYGFFMAMSFEFLVPAAILLSTLFTLWQLSRHSEITAMRCGGVSLFAIVRPFLLVATLAALGAAAIKEFVTPRGTEWVSAFLAKPEARGARVHYDVGFFNGISRRVWLVGRIDLNRPGALQDVKITCERGDGTRYQEIRAVLAEWLDGQWWFHDAAVQRFDEGDNPIGPAQGPRPGEPAVTEFGFLDEIPSDFVNELIDWDFLSARAVYRYIRHHPNLSHEDSARRRLALHQRLASPFAAIAAALFSIPAGIRGGRRSVMAGMVLTVTAFFGFHALSQVGAFLALRQWVAPWLGAWLSSIVFLGAGSIMVARIR